jgi:hypothetical protein
MISPDVGCWVPLEDGTPSDDTEQVRILHKIPTPTFTSIPVNCSQFTNRVTCGEAGPACYWNENLKTCVNK